MNLKNPLLPDAPITRPFAPTEQAGVETAAPFQFTMAPAFVPVVCGEFNRKIEAMADLNQRIVVPVPKN